MQQPVCLPFFPRGSDLSLHNPRPIVCSLRRSFQPRYCILNGGSWARIHATRVLVLTIQMFCGKYRADDKLQQYGFVCIRELINDQSNMLHSFRITAGSRFHTLLTDHVYITSIRWSARNPTRESRDALGVTISHTGAILCLFELPFQVAKRLMIGADKPHISSNRDGNASHRTRPQHANYPLSYKK